MKIKQVSLLILSICFGTEIYAQFLYRDLISVGQANEEMATYKKGGIKNIKIKSLEPNGEESEDFFCEKKISKDFRKSSLYTRTGNQGKSLMESFFNKQGLLIMTYDSSEIVVSRNEFFYDNNNRLSSTLSYSKSNDDDFVNEITEAHVYRYNEDGIPVSMLRIKNQTDTIIILFSPDENNNVGIEKETKNGSKYYYYYDENKRLTDVVHTNEFKQRLVADYVFEYNEEGKISSMTTTEDGNDNFTVWKYDYENHLKVKERIFDRNGMLMGKIIYEYK
jgi:hypothetical protein